MNENEEIRDELTPDNGGNAGPDFAEEMTKTEHEAALEAAFRKGLKAGTRRGALRGVLITAAAVIAVLLILLFRAGSALNTQGILYVTASRTEEDPGPGVLDQATMDKLATLSRYIDRYYLYDIDAEASREALAHALFESLDENYTRYYSAEEYEEYRQRNASAYHGIGITIQAAETGEIYIINTMHGSPAEEAGVLAGDRLMTINGTEVTGMETADIAAMVTDSELGDRITITVRREDTDETLTFDLTVSEVDYNYVSYTMEEDGVGYIYLSTFSAASAEQFTAALEDLRSQGLKGLVIDLRYNGGGSLDALVTIANSFLPEGEILRIDYTASGEEIFTSDGNHALDVPVAILVNGHTASASEALTGAAQDMGAAVIVGSQTFGKGIVQSFYLLDDGSAVKMTTAYYYTPSGVCIHGEGITPDIVVEMEPDETGDPQLAAAMASVRERME